ncbi:epoxide hydrolase family protein [Actinoplanes solisilvae]|uniref:epoxide hydrolase family protein n=1 Tax=Actinoplanes solisilvae TaxID=2486853 RepID=UPI000FD8388D|nr:epoxide hydrolase family protein [Actinoplanes solisilvae]
MSAFPLTPTPIHVPDEVLTDLKNRLANTRWSDDLGNEDWFYGVPREYLQELVEHWQNDYDWRAAEKRLNEYENYFVEVDGVKIHLLRKPGAGPDPKPLILTGGWPWVVTHLLPVVDRLAAPGEESYDVIVATIPGAGFSTPVSRPDLNFWKTADLWHKLMTEVLGYEKYFAAGSDMGAMVTEQLGHKYPDEVYAIHLGSSIPLTMFNGDRPWDLTGGASIPAGVPDELRQQILAWQKRFVAHVAVHVLDSATIGHGLTDSPAGMLAWVLERWTNWSDNDGDIENVWTRDEILTNATIFWVTNSISTSMRLYANAARYPWQPSHDRTPVIEAPTGITFVGYENPPGVTTEARVQDFLDSPKARWFNHVNLSAHPRGGHFGTWEVPDEWAADARRTFRGRAE